MKLGDLQEASVVHEEAFTRQRFSYQWLDSSLKAFPRILCYVAVLDKAVVGYIIWAQKSGFRPEVVLELDQIAVLQKYHAQGIGKELIESSLPLVKSQLSKQHSILKHITITTRLDNHSQKLYKKTLGAEVEATIKNLYSADEILMIARNV